MCTARSRGPGFARGGHGARPDEAAPRSRPPKRHATPRPAPAPALPPQPDRGPEHLVGDPEGVDQLAGNPRTSLHRRLTSRVMALQRGPVSRPCSWKNPRSDSITDSAYRSRTALSARASDSSSQFSIARQKDSRITRSMCARAASTAWFWTARKTSNGSWSSSRPRLKRRATDAVMCASRQRKTSSWFSASSSSPVSSLEGTKSAITCPIFRAKDRSSTVSTAWPATKVTVSRGSSSAKWSL